MSERCLRSTNMGAFGLEKSNIGTTINFTIMLKAKLTFTSQSGRDFNKGDVVTLGSLVATDVTQDEVECYFEEVTEEQEEVTKELSPEENLIVDQDETPATGTDQEGKEEKKKK